MHRPILVTGSHRSGTTWAGRMLCRSGEAGYIHEPFNPARRPSWCAPPMPYWFQYVTAENESRFEPVLRDVLAFRYPGVRNLRELRGPKRVAVFAADISRSLVYRARGPRPLLKDPIALFSAEWIASRFDAEVVVMIRHPAGFANSLKELGWRFKFRSWLEQDLLLRDWLHPFETEMKRFRDHDLDIVDQAALMWLAMHSFIDAMRTRHPDWVFVRYEDVAASPEASFERLYERLGLTWTAAVERAIARRSRAGNPGAVSWWRHRSVRRDSRATSRRWRRSLSAAEIERLRSRVAPVAERFYAESEWPAGPTSS